MRLVPQIIPYATTYYGKDHDYYKQFFHVIYILNR